jgi:hypothetical protein
MKTLLVIVTSLFVVSGHAQTAEPFQGAKQIIFSCEDSDTDLYRRIGQYLASAGFAIESSSADFLTIKTASRETSKWNYQYYLSCAVYGNKVTINVKWKLGASFITGTEATEFYDWEYAKAKGNVQNVIYRDVMEYMKDFGRIEVTYK